MIFLNSLFLNSFIFLLKYHIQSLRTTLITDEMNNFLKWLFIVVVIMQLCGCDALYRMLDKEGAEEKAIIGEVVPFEKNPTVEEIQALLKIYGYDAGKVDGVLGTQTRNAIARFQTDNQLKVSRFADKETCEKLRVFVDQGFVVDDNINIKHVQGVLKAAGFDPGPIDGKRGRKTEQAIKDFQKAHNLKVDARVGYQTLKEMSKYVSPVVKEE